MKPSIANPFNKIFGGGPAVAWAMLVGGVLWIVHGYFRFTTPLGPDVTWREDLGYSPIVSTGLFLLYNLPGVLALLLTAWAALSYLSVLRTAAMGLKRGAQALMLLALFLGLIAAAGQVIQFDPLTMAGLSFGLPVFGLALVLAGLTVSRDGNGQDGKHRLSGPGLILLGLIGMVTMPLTFMIYALALLPYVFGTAVLALFGAGWIILGLSLHKETVQNAGTVYA